MSEAHVSQNEILHKLQNKAQKVKKLEEACKKQEKVIDKLERLLSQRSSKGTELMKILVIPLKKYLL